jgi:biotin carboxyl carrier protein
MKVTVEVDGQRRELEIARRRDAAGGEHMVINHGGQAVNVRVVHRDGPHFVLEIEEQHGDHVQRRRLRAAGYSDGDARQLWVNGSNVYYRRIREHGARQPSSGSAAAGAALTASIPAVVSEILVSVGDHVSAGRKLILLESMKMILPIQAPHDGTVSAIHCAEGDAVQPGIQLIEIDEAGRESA